MESPDTADFRVVVQDQESVSKTPLQVADTVLSNAHRALKEVSKYDNRRN